MSGFIAIADKRSDLLDRASLENSINPLGTMNVMSAQTDKSLLLVTQHEQSPVANRCVVERADFLAIISGDIIDSHELEWNTIHNELLSGADNGPALQALRGAFSLVLFDKSDERLFVVTDPFAWQAVYVSITNGSFLASTSIAAFLNYGSQVPSVNEEWIYEFIYFNYGLLSTTPLSGVDRLPPASVTCYSLENDKLKQWRYRNDSALPSSPLAGPESAREALDVFNTVVPRYIPYRSQSIISLSAGLDCRAVIACIPPESLEGLHSFTFGLPETSEVVECNQIAERLGFKHSPVYLDNEFLRQLPALARETVYLSGGQQNINRSHLLHTYKALNCDGKSYATMLTGVSGDHIFRDHIRGYGNVPHIVSEDMAAQMRRGRSSIDREKYRGIMGNNCLKFEERIEYALDRIEQQYGECSDPHAYICYLMYEAGPRYFGGQLAITNMFTTFRSPYWDPEIVQLGFRLQDATLGFSSKLKSKDHFLETRLQASVVAASKGVRRIPYHEMPIDVFARGNRIEYELRRGPRKLKMLINQRRVVRGEDWPLWYETIMKEELARLLGEDSRVQKYVNSDFIRQSIKSSNVHWLGKLATAELTLRYLENGWQRLTER